MAWPEPIWIVAAAAGIQALMASLLWWQGKTLARAAENQAEAAQGSLVLSVEGALSTSAVVVKEALKEAGFFEQAWKIEKAFIDFVSRMREDPQDVEALLNLREPMLEGLDLLLRKEQADRLAAGRK